jgi:phage portal protein BeeE
VALPRFLDRVLNWGTPTTSERASPYNWQYPSFSFGGNQYPYGFQTTYPGLKQEPPDPSFTGYAQALYLANPVVFACSNARTRLFAEARFAFRRLRQGRATDDIFGNAALAPLEKPWPNGTTRNLLARAMQDVDLAGNFYAYREGQRINRMRPDWVSIVLGSNREPDDPALALDAEVIGYLYQPYGYGEDYTVALLPEQVCHLAPIPDPIARFRGISWITSLVSDVMADNAATQHKLQFFEQGATVNLAVTFGAPWVKTQEQFDTMVDAFRRGHEGAANAFKTMFFAAGDSATTIGSNLEEAAFDAVQGAGETRVCMAAAVPPIIIGASEGLDAATYSNYGQARRAFADLTMRPLWGEAAGAFASIIDVPSDAELWYDDTKISFLQEDEKDDAEILNAKMTAIRTGVDGGFKPETVVAAVNAGDVTLLKHTELFSVQLQPPGTEAPSPNGQVEPIGAVDE